MVGLRVGDEVTEDSCRKKGKEGKGCVGVGDGCSALKGLTSLLNVCVGQAP